MTRRMEKSWSVVPLSGLNPHCDSCSPASRCGLSRWCRSWTKTLLLVLISVSPRKLFRNSWLPLPFQMATSSASRQAAGTTPECQTAKMTRCSQTTTLCCLSSQGSMPSSPGLDWLHKSWGACRPRASAAPPKTGPPAGCEPVPGPECQPGLAEGVMHHAVQAHEAQELPPA